MLNYEKLLKEFLLSTETGKGLCKLGFVSVEKLLQLFNSYLRDRKIKELSLEEFMKLLNGLKRKYSQLRFVEYYDDVLKRKIIAVNISALVGSILI